MAANQLAELPSFIGNLIHLETLNVASNQLAELPSSIGNLVAIVELNVSGNQLRKLPSSIGNLVAIEELSMFNNQLTELPSTIVNLIEWESPRRRNFVDGNPLRLPPLAVATEGSEAIRRYFHDLAAGAAVSHACKLILVGDAEAGKSSLLQSWRNHCVPTPQPQDARTINVERHELCVGADDTEVRFVCWDLGGQEQYAAVQQVYMTPNALYVLVINADRVRRLLSMLRIDTLREGLDHILTLTVAPQTLLPTIGQSIPRLWLPAIGLLRALRDGRDPLAMALWELQLATDAATAGSSPAALAPVVCTAVRCVLIKDVQRDHWPRLAQSAQLQSQWPDVAEALTAPGYLAQLMSDVLSLLAGQGELFMAGGVVYLDSQLVTDLLSPIVDHRLDAQVEANALPLLQHVLETADALPSTASDYADAQSRLRLLNDGLHALVSPAAELHAEVLPYFWRHLENPTHFEGHLSTLCEVGILFPVDAEPTTGAARWIMPVRLPEKPPSVALAQYWPVLARPGETRRSAIRTWHGELPPGLAERAVVAIARQPADFRLYWRNGVLLQCTGSNNHASSSGSEPVSLHTLLQVDRLTDGDDVTVRLAVRGTQKAAVEAELTALVARVLPVFDFYPGLCVSDWEEREEVIDVLPIERLQNVVVISVTNTHDEALHAGAEHVSARKLNAVLSGLNGVRALEPWVDCPGGKALLDRLQATINADVKDGDDGLVFTYSGHGDAQVICGEPVRGRLTVTKCKDILKLFAAHPRLSNKFIIVIFDNCRDLPSMNAKAQFDDLGPKTLVAFSTRLGSQSWIDEHRGCLYTDALADVLEAHGGSLDIESILKLLNRRMTTAARLNEAPPISHNLTCQLFLGGNAT